MNYYSINKGSNARIELLCYEATSQEEEFNYGSGYAFVENLEMHFCTTAESWRVVLKGESKDYIHASFANVRV